MSAEIDIGFDEVDVRAAKRWADDIVWIDLLSLLPSDIRAGISASVRERLRLAIVDSLVGFPGRAVRE